MSDIGGLTRLSYGTVRLRWCAAALGALLRRWGIAVAVGLVVLGSGASAGFSGMGGLLAFAVFPLVDAVQRPLPQQLMLALAHSLVGALLLVAVRPLLWPRAWAEAEAALPLRRATLRRSDLTVLALALAPLLLTYAAGVASWVSALPANAPFPRGRLLGLLSMSAVLSLGWGLLMLHLTRWPPAGWDRSRRQALRRRPSKAGGEITVGGAVPFDEAALGHANDGAEGTGTFAPHGRWAAHWAWVLVALPLWRGPATRVGRLLLLASAVLTAPAVALALWPRWGAWWLAALAAAGMALTARLHAVTAADLAPLHQACRVLPLRDRALRHARQALVIWPISLALAIGAAWVLHLQVPVRPAVLAAYGAASWGFNLLQIVWAANPDASRTSTRVTFWLLMQVILLALASEVMK